MALKIARFVNLLLAALLVGNEFGTWAAVHRSLWNRSIPEHVRAEQTFTHRFKSITPFWMSSVVVSCLPVLALTRNRDPFARRSTLAGTFCFIGMMVSTLLGNMPINNRTLELSPAETPPEEWKQLTKRWERLHSLRVLLNVAGDPAAAGSAERIADERLAEAVQEGACMSSKASVERIHAGAYI